MKEIKQAISYNLLSGFNVILLFFNTIILNKILQIDILGSWVLYSNFINILVIIFNLGLNGSIIFWINKEKNKSIEILLIFARYLFYFSLIIFPIIFILYFCNKIDLVFDVRNQNLISYIILYCTVIITLLINLFSSFLQANSLFNKTIFISITFQLILLIIYSILYLNKLQVMSISLFMYLNLFLLVAQISFLIISFSKIYNFYSLLKSDLPKFSLNSKYLKFSFLVYFTNILQTLSYKIDFWFVGYYIGKEKLPVYALAAMLAQSTWIISNSLSVIIYTKTSNHEITSIRELKKYFFYNFFFIIIISSLIYLFSEYFLINFLGSNFKSLLQLLKILFLGVLPFSFINIICGFNSGKGLFEINFYTSLIGFVLGIISYIILIPKLGILGGAWGSVISYLSSTIFILYFYIKKNL